MIYLSKQKILFLRPRKVASTSFEAALARFAGPGDIVTPIAKEDEQKKAERRFALRQNYKEPFRDILKSARKTADLIRYRKRKTLFYHHISAKLARERLGHELFEDAFKISIVRNPYDLLVSFYFWRMRGNDNPPPFVEWIRRSPEVLNLNRELYFVDSEYVIDFQIRYESLETDILELERRRPELSGLSHDLTFLSSKSGVRPKSGTAPKMFEHENVLRETVGFFNRDVIERFGYHL